MNVKVNGKDQSFQRESLTVFEMLTLCQVSQPEMVSVQLNGGFVNRADFGTTPVKHGDEIDFLYFMGGGDR